MARTSAIEPLDDRDEHAVRILYSKSRLSVFFDDARVLQAACNLKSLGLDAGRAWVGSPPGPGSWPRTTAF